MNRFAVLATYPDGRVFLGHVRARDGRAAREKIEEMLPGAKIEFVGITGEDNLVQVGGPR